MAYQHAIIFVIHLVCYLMLYPFWKKFYLLSVGFFIMMQLMGIDALVIAFKYDNPSLVSGGLILLVCPLLISFVMSDRPICVEGKKYYGLQEYLLLFDTKLKYVVGFFLLSLIFNLYLDSSTGLLKYSNLTSVGAFLLSIPFCKRMRKLEEKDAANC